MRAVLAAVLAAAAIVASGLGAAAGNCASAIVVFGRTQAQKDAGLGAFNPNGVVCAEPVVGESAPADTRVLTPMASEISIRYTRDLGPFVAGLTATVNGLGFNNALVSLPRYVDPTTGLVSYASSFTRIPIGDSAAGSVVVRIAHPLIPGGADVVCFRTWQGSCPS